LIDRSIDR